MMPDPDRVFAELTALYPEARCALRYETDLELLVAVILSAQTTDEAVNAATPALFSRFRTVDDYAEAELLELESFLRHLGLYQNKARYLRDACREIRSRFGGIIPATRAELESLPGVGRKTADVFLAEWHHVPGIAVDTHVHRVSWRLGFSAREDSPSAVSEKLMAVFPQDRWISLHHKMIFFGRDLCRARIPACRECPFRDFCREPKKTA